MEPGQSGHGPASATREPTLKVAAVAKRLGVAPATLRTWARRYGLGPPAHTAGAHRQYTPEDLTRLLEMRRLTLEGVAPGEAARIALELDVDPAAAAAAAGITGLALPVARAVPALEDAPASTVRPGPRSAGLGRRGGLVAAPDGARPGDTSSNAVTSDRSVDHAGTRTSSRPLPEPARLLVEAARALDGAAMRRQLLDLVAEGGVIRTWEAVAVPALDAVGSAPGRGCYAERALVQALLQVLGAVTVNAEEPVFGDVLLACVDDEQHSLPLTVLAAALAERRVDADLLGGQVPASALLDAVRRRRPKIVLLYAAREVPPAQQMVLEDVDGRTRLLLGGSAWDGVPLPDGAVHAPSLATALDQIRLAVRH